MSSGIPTSDTAALNANTTIEQPAVRETECVGLLTASASHELQNALAVIRESAGLMQDIMSLAGDALPRRDRMMQLVALIQQQVVRGGEIAGGLNGLGHAWQEEGSDLHRVLEEFAILAGRLGHMHGVTVGLERSSGKVRAPKAGLALRVALFDALQTCFRHAPGISLTLSPLRYNGVSGVLMHITPSTNAAHTINKEALSAEFVASGIIPIGADAVAELPMYSLGLNYFLSCEDSCSMES